MRIQVSREKVRHSSSWSVLLCLDQYDQLKKYVSTFFNPTNGEHYLTYGQQQMLNIQETFFKSRNSFAVEICFWGRYVLDCEPIDLTDYESRQEQIVQTAVEKWLQT